MTWVIIEKVWILLKCMMKKWVRIPTYDFWGVIENVFVVKKWFMGVWLHEPTKLSWLSDIFQALFDMALTFSLYPCNLSPGLFCVSNPYFLLNWNLALCVSNPSCLSIVLIKKMEGECVWGILSEMLQKKRYIRSMGKK